VLGIAGKRGSVDAPPLRVVEAGELAGQPLRRAMALVTLSWVFGSVWATAIGGAPFSLFAKDLRASELQIGILAALPFLASLVSMPASLLTERTGQRKKIFLIGLYAQRLLWLPIALVPLWMVTHGVASSMAVIVFMVLIFVMHAAGAVGGPAWMSWMADIVPDRCRGKYFSRRRQWGILSAIPTALAVGWILDHWVVPGDGLGTLRWCAIIFMCAAVFGLVDIHMFTRVPDVPMEPRRGTPVIKLLGGPLKDRQFLHFAGFVGTLTFAVSFMGQFVTFYLIDKIGVTGTGIQLMLLVAPMLAQLLVLPVWGHAADRTGKKPVLAIASLGLVPVGLGWCFMGPGNYALGYALSVLGAALWTGVEVANMNFVLEFSGSGSESDDGAKQGGSAYVAVNSVIINIAGCCGGLCAGVIAKLLKDWQLHIGMFGLGTVGFYEVLFALSGVLRLVAAAAFLPGLREPEARSTVEALRFMSANIYHNLFNAILMPMRVLRVRNRESEEVEPVVAPAPRPMRRAA
jgi:MFS family permease